LVVSLLILVSTVNVAAASTGLTHKIGAELDAIGTAVDIFNASKEGNAPIRLDGTIIVRLVLQANRFNRLRRRAQNHVPGIVAITESTPMETVPVAVPTHCVKRLEDLAEQFGGFGVAYRVIATVFTFAFDFTGLAIAALAIATLAIATLAIATLAIATLADRESGNLATALAAALAALQLTKRRRLGSLVRTAGSSISGGQDGSKKESKVQGNDLHGRWSVRVVDVGSLMVVSLVRL
jgi:hypothetical protein